MLGSLRLIFAEQQKMKKSKLLLLGLLCLAGCNDGGQTCAGNGAATRVYESHLIGTRVDDGTDWVELYDVAFLGQSVLLHVDVSFALYQRWKTPAELAFYYRPFPEVGSDVTADASARTSIENYYEENYHLSFAFDSATSDQAFIATSGASARESYAQVDYRYTVKGDVLGAVKNPLLQEGLFYWSCPVHTLKDEKAAVIVSLYAIPLSVFLNEAIAV